VDKLEEAAVFQVVLDDDVCDGVKHELNVIGVGGTREVSVNFLEAFFLVQVFKFHLDVGSGFFKCIRAWKSKINYSHK
jgi:hypothetical protein